MNEFTGDIWSWYIGIITIVSILACGVLLWTMSTTRVAGNTAQTTGHVWDEDLGEYNNPLPRWWIWMFYLSIAFGLGYLVMFPGLGSYGGTLGWSSIGEHTEDVASAQQTYAPVYARFAGKDIAELAADPQARSAGQKLFLNNCAQCHASDAAGSKGFPNLTDADWLYGGEPKLIEQSILEGRNGMMPPFGAALPGEGAKNVAHFVLSLSGRTFDPIRAAQGKEFFKGTCAACHGTEGKGNIALGAPNLTDQTWLHGSSEKDLIETISKGRSSAMPAHKDLLGEQRVKLLAAYVYGLRARGDGK